jgi:hypothetical protein
MPDERPEDGPTTTGEVTTTGDVTASTTGEVTETETDEVTTTGDTRTTGDATATATGEVTTAGAVATTATGDGTTAATGDMTAAAAAAAAMPGDGTADGGPTADELTAGLLRLHADRMHLLFREQRTRDRFAARHPEVAVTEVAALPGDVHDLAGLRDIGDRLAAGRPELPENA